MLAATTASPVAAAAATAAFAVASSFAEASRCSELIWGLCRTLIPNQTRAQAGQQQQQLLPAPIPSHNACIPGSAHVSWPCPLNNHPDGCPQQCSGAGHLVVKSRASARSVSCVKFFESVEVFDHVECCSEQAMQPFGIASRQLDCMRVPSMCLVSYVESSLDFQALPARVERQRRHLQMGQCGLQA